MDNDALTIATAIDPTRQGWCWMHSHIFRPTLTEPDIGPHNILKVIEWAAEQGEYSEALETISRLLNNLCRRWRSVSLTTASIQKQLAAAIRAGKGAIT